MSSDEGDGDGSSLCRLSAKLQREIGKRLEAIEEEADLVRWANTKRQSYAKRGRPTIWC